MNPVRYVVTFVMPASLLLPQLLLSAPTTTINYQVSLKDVTGKPVTDSTSLIFRRLTAPEGRNSDVRGSRNTGRILSLHVKRLQVSPGLEMQSR